METRKRLKVRCPSLPDPPVVLYYPNGAPSDIGAGETGIFTNAKNDFAIVQDDPKHNTTYIGTMESSETKPCHYALGVFDKRKGKLKLYSILGESVFRMEPKVEGLQYEPSKTTTIIESKDEIDQGKRMALERFGNASAKKRIRSQNQFLSEQSEEVNKAMETMVMEITDEAKRQGWTQSQILEQSSQIRILPPYDEKGTTLNEAYPFQLICPAYYQAQLSYETFVGAAKESTIEMELRKSGTSLFVLKYLKKLNEMEEDEQEDFAKILAFLNALLQLYKIRNTVRRVTDHGLNNFAHRNGFHNISFFKFLLSLFFEHRQKIDKGGNFQFPEGKLKLLLCYILVMALKVTESEMQFEDFDTLRRELKLTRKALTEYFEYIGAKISGKTRQDAFRIKLLKNNRSLEDNLPPLTSKTAPKRRRNYETH